MEMWENARRDHRNWHRRENPSFSSSLLDAIYRSFDETNGKSGEGELMIFYAEPTRKNLSTFLPEEEDKMVNFRRTGKKTHEKASVRRTSMADFDRKARNVRERDFKMKNSSSSSSDSSSGCGFSSSESEYLYRPKGMKSSNSAPLGRPRSEEKFSAPIRKPKIDMDSVKTQYSKALKMYNELKKMKQPISPGRKVASFLNSLFNGGSLKKLKFSNSVDLGSDDYSTISKSEKTSSCSSASSFSKSCLSKAPYPGEKLGNNGDAKRCVRFCPVSVIVEENLPGDDDPGLRNTKMSTASVKNNAQKIFDSEEDDEDDDDAASDSSSDLFELENLSSIGIERFREELPVYETTHFNANLAIANGLIL